MWLLQKRGSLAVACDFADRRQMVPAPCAPAVLLKSDPACELRGAGSADLPPASAAILIGRPHHASRRLQERDSD